jgi:hypothetical protein
MIMEKNTTEKARKRHSVRTGMLKFENDWPGVFIRGDDAFGYAWALECLMSDLERRARELLEQGRADELSDTEGLAWLRIRELAKLLRSCWVTSKDASIRSRCTYVT